jgi:predicted amidophosphoribosyltransferase
MAHSLIDLVFPSSCIVCGNKPKPICLGCKPQTEIGQITGFGFPILYAHRHQDDIEKLISGYKDQQLTSLEKTLADSVAELFSQFDVSGIDAVITPARNTKNYRKRGFDPARSLAKRGLRALHLNVPVLNLASVRARSDQRGLGRDDRAKNVAGSMQLGTSKLRKVVLFDDVLTTGVTVSEMARACKDAEVEVVHCCVLAERFTKF